MGKKKNKPEGPIKSLKDAEQAVTSDNFGGDTLDELLSKLIRSVEVAKALRGGLPEKVWMKQQFCVRVNDVTRVLERMPAAVASHCGCSSEGSTHKVLWRAPLVPLQVVLIAADCNPKWLTKHIPTLASTRQVPVLCLKDNKGSSLRLGQVANVKTALAIGMLPFQFGVGDDDMPRTSSVMPAVCRTGAGVEASDSESELKESFVCQRSYNIMSLQSCSLKYCK
nr:uncharacterized protein LOC127328405 [Lolium perenne]